MGIISLLIDVVSIHNSTYLLDVSGVMASMDHMKHFHFVLRSGGFFLLWSFPFQLQKSIKISTENSFKKDDCPIVS